MFSVATTNTGISRGLAASPNSLPHRGHAIEELFEQKNPRFSVLPVWFLVGIVKAIVVATGHRLHDDAIPPRHHIQVLVDKP